jgi:hypothetical protein
MQISSTKIPATRWDWLGTRQRGAGPHRLILAPWCSSILGPGINATTGLLNFTTTPDLGFSRKVQYSTLIEAQSVMALQAAALLLPSTLSVPKKAAVKDTPFLSVSHPKVRSHY